MVGLCFGLVGLPLSCRSGQRLFLSSRLLNPALQGPQLQHAFSIFLDRCGGLADSWDHRKLQSGPTGQRSHQILDLVRCWPGGGSTPSHHSIFKNNNGQLSQPRERESCSWVVIWPSMQPAAISWLACLRLRMLRIVTQPSKMDHQLAFRHESPHTLPNRRSRRPPGCACRRATSDLHLSDPDQATDLPLPDLARTVCHLDHITRSHENTCPRARENLADWRRLRRVRRSPLYSMRKRYACPTTLI